MIYNIAYASDDTYCQHMGISIISLFETNKDILNLDVYILNNNINPDNLFKLLTIANNYNRKLHILDCSSIIPLLSSIPSEWNIGTYLRLFIHKLTDVKLEKILYLDCDLIVNGSIRDFYNEDLNGYFAAGIPDIYNCSVKNKIGLSNTDLYINAGVLLINLTAWRDFNIDEKFIEYILNPTSPLCFPDQDTINIILKNKIKIVSMQYNQTMFSLALPYKYALCLMEPFSRKYYNESDYCYAQHNPVIIHYAGSLFGRPWNKKSHQPYADLYLSYLSISPWHNVQLTRRVYTKKRLSSLYLMITENVLKMFWLTKLWGLFVCFYIFFSKFPSVVHKIKRNIGGLFCTIK